MNVAKTPIFITVAQRTTARVPSCDANPSSRPRSRPGRRRHGRGERHRPRRGAALRGSRPPGLSGRHGCGEASRRPGQARRAGHRGGDRRLRPLVRGVPRADGGARARPGLGADEQRRRGRRRRSAVQPRRVVGVLGVNFFGFCTAQTFVPATAERAGAPGP
jgi:hypothetical protein